jgi:hypothetical protein
MVLLTLAIPFMGVAVATHGDSATTAIDVTQVQLSPDTASMPPGGACVQFTAQANDGTATAEGETLDILATISDDDGAAGATGEDDDLTLAFCDPDAGGPIISLTGTDTDDGPGLNPTEAPATIQAECVTDVNGQCVFGLSVTDIGTGANQGGSGSVTAWADFNDNEALDNDEPRDVSTFTVGAGTVANIACTPATQSQPEGGRAEFQCTATNAAGQPLAAIVITGDVQAGPNVEETANFTCTTLANGQTPAPATNPPATSTTPTAGACGYNDAGANTPTSPPGTDTVAFCTQAAAGPGQPSTSGCDPHELSAQGNASATVTWVGQASRITCTPDGANAQPGTTVLVTCSVTDINNQPSPAGVDCTFTETGPGTVAEQNNGLTNASGQCTATATTFSNETGLQTITGTLVGGLGTNCQQAPNAGTPVAGAPAGTTCSDTASINWGGTTTQPPPPTDCADGSDNDGDARIDLDDRGCRSADDPTEAGPFASTVTIRLRRARPRGFTGSVASSFESCQVRRQVTVVRRGGGSVGTDTTDRDGNYFIRFRGRRGRFQARLAPRTLNVGTDQVTCRGDRSPIIGVRRRRR